MAEIIINFFLFKGFEIIIKKYDGYQKFELFCAKQSISILYQLSKCKFCMDHHLAIVSTLIVCQLLGGWHAYHLILPIVTASINNTLNDRSKD